MLPKTLNYYSPTFLYNLNPEYLSIGIFRDLETDGQFLQGYFPQPSHFVVFASLIQRVIQRQSTNMESKEDLTALAQSQTRKEIENESQVQIGFGFQISCSRISDLFQQVASDLGFEMIQKQLQNATAIKQVKKSFLHYIDCFNWVTEASMTAVKMTLQTSEKKSMRICRIKGLLGSKKQVRHLLDSFKSKSHHLLKMHVSTVEEGQEMLEQPENPFHLQACAAYMFHKILSNEQYGIGSVLGRSIKDYAHCFGDVQKSASTIPLPMKNAVAIVREIVDNLYKDFNLGRKEMEKIMPYCRISVQKYVFDKIEMIVYPIYSHRTSEQMAIFEQKRNRIFATRKLKDIFSYINLQRDNWMLEEDIMSNEQQNLERLYSRKELRSRIKYRKGCEELEKMSHVSSPREKMKHCQIAYSILKTVYYEASSKGRELTNMEDIIPILIVVVLLSQIGELKAQLNVVTDFIEFDNCDLESERRLMLNFSESFNYVYRDWKI